MAATLATDPIGGDEQHGESHDAPDSSELTGSYQKAEDQARGEGVERDARKRLDVHVEPPGSRNPTEATTKIGECRRAGWSSSSSCE